MRTMTRAVLTASLVVVLSCAVPLREDRSDGKVRGFSFLPRAGREVAGTVRIDVPVSCARKDDIHGKEKYPIAIFTAGCDGAAPCFTLSIMVMIIPESVRSFEGVVEKSLVEDFGAGDVKKINEALITSPESGAGKVLLYYGPSFLMGSHIIGYYHSAAKKKTSKVVLGLTHIEPFTDDEWRTVLVNSVEILKSVKFRK